MVIMLANFVAVRQIDLFLVTRCISNTAQPVGFSCPVGWTACCIVEAACCCLRRMRKQDGRQEQKLLYTGKARRYN